MKPVYFLAAALLVSTASCQRDLATPAAQWAEQPTGQSLANVQNLAFSSAQAGWVVGGYRVPVGTGARIIPSLLRTTDGGSRWDALDLTPANTVIGFRSFYPVSPQLIYGVADDLPLSLVPGAQARFVYRSQDAGATWQRLPSTGFTDGAVAFPTPQVGLSAYSTGISRSPDGGTTWQAAWNGTAQHQWVSQLRFPTPAVGYAAGNCLLKTTDQGQTWQDLNWNSPLEIITDLQFVSNEVGFIVTAPSIVSISSTATQTGQVYRTLNGGQTWQVLGAAQGTYAFLSAQEFYRAGTTIERTRDGGQTWQAEYTLPAGPTASPNFLVSICFPTAASGYAVTNQGVVLKRLP